MIERTVAKIVAAALRLPWLTIVLGMALTAGAIQYITSHFAITTDTSQLISSELDWRQREQQFDAAFPQHTDTIEVVIDGTTPELWSDMQLLGSQLTSTNKYLTFVVNGPTDYDLTIDQIQASVTGGVAR